MSRAPHSLTLGLDASGKTFVLPVDLVTQTVAILARKRVGKTYTASVIAEEFAEAGIPFVVLDPTGAWWGLRSLYPIVIIGGAHGDVPLEATAGKVIADLVTEHPGFYIIDLSQTASNAEQDRFAADFAERLYRAKEKHRFPLHLFVDEADSFAPQRPFPGQLRMLGAFEAIVRRGGIRGLGMTLITQRPAVLNKNVLTQSEVLVVLQMTGPQDQDAIEDWVKRNGTKEERDTMMASLASLQLGEAWVWSPSWLQCFEKIKVRERRTFNSSATPKAGEKPVTPDLLTSIDLEKLGMQIAETVERAKENDPAQLKGQIVKLKAELAKKPAAAAAPAAPPVQVAILDEKSKSNLESIRVDLDLITTQLSVIQKTLPNLREQLEYVAREIGLRVRASRPLVAGTQVFDRRAGYIKTHADYTKPSKTPAPRTSRDSSGKLNKAERSILTCLAQFGACSKNKVAAVTAYAVTGGGFNNALGALRSAGFIEPGEPIEVTAAGKEALGTWEPLPTGSALIQHWLRQLTKAEAMIFEFVCHEYPESCTKEEIATATFYEPSGGGFNNALGRLRTLELITRGTNIRASEHLFS